MQEKTLSIKNTILISLLFVSLIIGIFIIGIFYYEVEHAESIAKREAGVIAKTVTFFVEDIVKDTSSLRAMGESSELQNIIVKFRNFEKRDIAIVDMNEKIIADAVPEEIGTVFLHDPNNEVAHTLKDGQIRTFTEISKAYPQGIKLLAYPLELESGKRIGGVILEYTPLYNEVMKWGKSRFYKLMVVYAGVLCIFIVLGYLISRKIYTPLIEINNAALKIAGGDMETRVSYESSDELGLLADSFNRMTENLKESRDKILTSHKKLEEEIIERKTVEERLKKAINKIADEEAKTKSIIKGLGVGIIIQDLNYKILYENELQQKKIGNHIGEFCYAAYEGKDHICEDCPMVLSLQDGGIHRTERRIPTEEGDIYYELISSALLDSEGKIGGGIKVVKDITELRQTAEKLREHRAHLLELVEQRTAEALQSAHLASIGELAAGVAHEINNPINGVINYAQILADRMLKGSKEEDMARRILKEGNRVSEIVHSLLTFARQNKDKKLSVNVSDILSETLTLTMAQLRKDNIHLDINMPGDLPLVLANPQQLQQVFLNILNNARYALNQKYPNLHEYKKIEIRGDLNVAMHDTPHVQISFLDYGPGISSDNLNKVLNPFFTTKPAGIGTGLGLSISDGLIKNHGGSLKLESKEGEFTEVIIDLPVIEKDET